MIDSIKPAARKAIDGELAKMKLDLPEEEKDKLAATLAKRIHELHETPMAALVHVVGLAVERSCK